MPTVPGVTYRQLDHWSRRGYLGAGTPGSGRTRQWSAVDLAQAEVMGRLVKAGVQPRVAAKVAAGQCEIAPGIQICIDEPGQSAPLP